MSGKQIESIIGIKQDTKSLKFLVKWKQKRTCESTWEPASSFPSRRLLSKMFRGFQTNCILSSKKKLKRKLEALQKQKSSSDATDDSVIHKRYSCRGLGPKTRSSHAARTGPFVIAVESKEFPKPGRSGKSNLDPKHAVWSRKRNLWMEKVFRRSQTRFAPSAKTSKKH